MNASRGRDTARLLADFGHQLPTLDKPAPPVREARFFPPTPRRGVRQRGRGWAPASAPVSVWRMTSDQAPVLWPLIAAPGLPPTGAQMGIDHLSGGSFYADPNGWVLDDAIPVTNPNIFAFGKPGRGKSGTVKAFCLRMMDFGYRTLILGDPKDEYEKLCRALGVQPFAIGHGLGAVVRAPDNQSAVRLKPGPAAVLLADALQGVPGAHARLNGDFFPRARGPHVDFA